MKFIVVQDLKFCAFIMHMYIFIFTV